MIGSLGTDLGASKAGRVGVSLLTSTQHKNIGSTSLTLTVGSALCILRIPFHLPPSSIVPRTCVDAGILVSSHASHFPNHLDDLMRYKYYYYLYLRAEKLEHKKVT